MNVLVEANIISYSEDLHREDYYDMFMKYGNWLDTEVLKHYGVHLFPDGDTKLIESFIPRFTSIKPPIGDIFIIEVDGESAGMGRLSTLEEGIGEVNNVYIRTKYRRKGLATLLMGQLEGKAREFGFKTLRLDTAGFNVPAQTLYKKLGYKDIERYSDKAGFENESTRPYYEEKVFMEKKL